MTCVLDATAMVALLVDTGRTGEWVEQLRSEHDLVAPHLLPVETTNALRRHVAARGLEAHIADDAHQRLTGVPVVLFEYAPFAERVWELKDNVSAYDAWYVALAESLDAPLVTLDGRLMRARGPRCAFAVPPAAA